MNLQKLIKDKGTKLIYTTNTFGK